jgi:hypothetical protein
MDGIDPEKLRQMGEQALRNLLDTQRAYIQELLDNDDAFAPEQLAKTREQLRISIAALHELGVEAIRK